MTAYAAPRAAYRPYLPPMGQGAASAVRNSLRGLRSAFRAAPARQDMDDAVLLMFGRD